MKFFVDLKNAGLSSSMKIIKFSSLFSDLTLKSFSEDTFTSRKLVSMNYVTD